MHFNKSVFMILWVATSAAMPQPYTQEKKINFEKHSRRNSKMPKDFESFVREYSISWKKLIEQLRRNDRSNETEKFNDILDEMHPKIINGRPANEGEFPWMVALYYNGRYTCSSSLISQTVVLTAAHCVTFNNGAEPASAFYGIAGNISRTSPETRIEFSEVIPHPRYGRGSEFDIAVLKTSQPVETSEFIQPICLPKAGREFEQFYVHAIGWGVTSNDVDANAPEMLRTTELQVPLAAACQALFTALMISITDRHVCANSYAPRGVCFGDSGGPLVYDDPMSGRPIAIGVASFVTFLGCGRPIIPNVYTATSSYTDWLTETAGENGDLCFV